MSSLSDKEQCVLRILNRRGRLTKHEIARACGFSRSTLASVVTRLLNLSLVDITDGSSRGGRRPGLVGLRDDAARLLGVDIGTHFIRSVVTDANGKVLASTVQEREPYNYDILAVPNVEASADAALAKCDLRRSDIDAIGIGISGIVDESAGVCLFLNKVPEWRDFPVRDHFADVFENEHVYVRDSTNAMATAERRFGSCVDDDDFVAVRETVGDGGADLARADDDHVHRSDPPSFMGSGFPWGRQEGFPSANSHIPSIPRSLTRRPSQPSSPQPTT